MCLTADVLRDVNQNEINIQQNEGSASLEFHKPKKTAIPPKTFYTHHNSTKGIV